MKRMGKLKRHGGEGSSLLFSLFLAFCFYWIILEISLSFFLLALLFQLFYILVSQHQLVGNSLQVTGRQFKDIYDIALENAKDLRIKMPKIFIVQDPYLNAFTIGFKPPYSIVLTSSLVESLSKNEIDFVIGHEMGHVKFGHSRILSFISPLGKDIPFVSWLYAFWQRKAEYTADRAGFFVTKGIKPTTSAMVKLAVGKKLASLIDIDEVIEQMEKSRSGLMAKTGELFLTHPYVTNRIRTLVEYSRFGA